MGCEKNSGNTPDSTTQSLCSCCCRNRPLPTWQSPWLLCVSLRAATTFQTSPVYCSFVNLGAEVMLFPVQEMWLLHFWVSPSPVAVTEQPDQLTLISSFMTCNHLNSFWQLSHIWERQLIIASSWFSWKLRSQMVCPFLVALVWFSGRPGKCPDLVWLLISCVSLANPRCPAVWLNTTLVMLLWSCYLDVCACMLSRVNRPALCNLMDHSSSVHRILQARLLKGVILPSSRDLANPGRDRTHISATPAMQGDSLSLSHLWSPFLEVINI